MSEALVLHELWVMTGCDPRQRPDREIYRDAFWARQHLASLEGRPLEIPAAPHPWHRDKPTPDHPGVDVFAP